VPYAKRSVDRAPLRYEPLARRILSGTGIISLNVYNYSGQPEVNAEADWWVFEELDYGTGYAFTDSNGHVDLTGVPAAASANGEVAVYLDNTTDYGMYDLYNMSWGATGLIAGLQPGRLPFTLVHDTSIGWEDWSAARVRLWAQNAGGELHMARTDIPKTGATTTGFASTISTGPESLVGGSVYFWDDEGMEIPVNGITVSSGSQASPGQIVHQSDAQRVWMDYWGSGKPGTSTWLILNNYPTGWVNQVYGVADYPSSARVKAFGNYTSTGEEYQGKRVVIPSTAAPGYRYWVWAEHDEGPLSLQTWFQTCTLKPSRATVSRGTAIALSGVVPIKGHYGSKKGTPKYVHIYKTTSSKLAAKGQPPVVGGSTREAGWTKVGKVRTDGLGKYRKGSIRPARTTWYVAWYPGDSWYWGAWTSVTKVTVR
jgi:hypothetical protein